MISNRRHTDTPSLVEDRYDMKKNKMRKTERDTGRSTWSNIKYRMAPVSELSYSCPNEYMPMSSFKD